MSKFAVMRGYLVSQPFRVAEIERETAKMYFFVKRSGTTYWRLSKDNPKIVAVFPTEKAAEVAIAKANGHFNPRIEEADKQVKHAQKVLATLRAERVEMIKTSAQS